MGLANTVTMGVVSSPARQLSAEDFMQYIQTDTPINPGNSGGPRFCRWPGYRDQHDDLLPIGG